MSTSTPKKTATTKAARRDRRRRRLRLAGLVVLSLCLAGAWVWQRTLPVSRVEVVGAVHADSSGVVRLTGVVPDSAALFSLSPALLADRAQRHPWVRRAHVRRMPTGTLRVRVEERTPVALVMADGRPDHFLDTEGYAMPVVAGAVYDLPLLTGAVPAYHPTQRVSSASLRELLLALGQADAATDALVSEIDWRPGRITLWTSPAGGQSTIPVRLGRSGYADALGRLRAFWDQSVLPRPETAFQLVDLRFRGQVVTQETPPDSTARSAALL